MAKLIIGISGFAVGVAAALLFGLQSPTRSSVAQNEETIKQQAAELAQMASQNQRLSNELALATSRSASDGTSNELLRLRNEVTQLKRQTAEVKPQAQTLGNASTDGGIDAASRELVSRVARMKQALEQMPEKRIPELALLDNQAWLRNAIGAQALDTDAGLLAQLSRLRSDAKSAFAQQMGSALQKYTQANGGELPQDPTQLKPFFDLTVDDSALQRYQMLKSGNVNGLQPNDMVVGEKAPVDDQYDTLMQVGLNGSQSTGVGNQTGQRMMSNWSHSGGPNTSQQMRVITH